MLNMEDEELAKILDQRPSIVLHPMQDMIDGTIYTGMRHTGGIMLLIQTMRLHL